MRCITVINRGRIVSTSIIFLKDKIKYFVKSDERNGLEVCAAKMSISLFEHNQTAYSSAAAMLSETGKAAVIHPTGTGKSFIGFRLCEDNPKSSVLWLAPSEYIFRTQLENLRRTGAEVPGNITFFTYAKLSVMESGEIEALQADLIVLDEFHRAGAEVWGQAIKQLLSTHESSGILGLSATNIRYLDNQRDMADELFDGNIASEMTLGEAIVRGIINPPKYVLSVFSYEKEFERYKKRVENCRSPWIKDEAQRYLEALQRTLENAEGLDAIFDRHMTERTGKYIVFCADYEHMKTMISVSAQWFEKVDSSPKVYSVFSGDPASSQSFADFKADNDRSHLRLLFCIDALNEGIHLDDISGVILLRPTVSPIIYKQQIGRAMSASRSANAVIFDIVDNISGLYSIDSIREEMETVIENYRLLGEGGLVVNEKFRVFDELRDCRELFDKLEGTLYASWEQMFEMAKRYYEENGDLLPPEGYRTEEGYRLGQWVITQRASYRDHSSLLTPERIEKLASVGMCWDTRLDRLWNGAYGTVKKYFDENGSLDGIREYSESAGMWLVKQRQKYRAGQLTEAQIEKLESVGMQWELEDRWSANYEAAREYFLENGNLDIPARYVLPSGVQLGKWCQSERSKYKKGTLPPERRKLLEDIGMGDIPLNERTWLGYYEELKKYHAANGNADVPLGYLSDDGKNLWNWVTSQRVAYSKNRLSREHIRLLEELDFTWDVFSYKWNVGFSHAEKYLSENGDLNVPGSYKCSDGYALGRWLLAQRQGRNKGTLTEERREKLDRLGMQWDPHEKQWKTGYEHAKSYFSEYGDLKIPVNYVSADGFKLGAWLSQKKVGYRKGALPPEYALALEKLGVRWSERTDQGEKRSTLTKPGEMRKMKRKVRNAEYRMQNV